MICFEVFCGALITSHDQWSLKNWTCYFQTRLEDPWWECMGLWANYI